MSSENIHFEEEDDKRNARKRSHQNKIYRFFYKLVTSVSFNFTMFILILANSITLAMYTYDQTDQ